MSKSASEMFEEKTEGMTEGPWHYCDANEGRCKCGQIWSKKADCCVAEIHPNAFSSDLMPFPTTEAERYINETGICFLRNLRDAFLEYIRAGEELAPELRALEDTDSIELAFLAALDALRERMEQ